MLRCVGKPDRDILRDSETYGLNHRTQLGLTPLMFAAVTGNVALAAALVDRGADVTVRDHVGRQAVHWLLRSYFSSHLPHPTVVGTLYDLVAPAAFDVQNDGRVYQIGKEMGEYFPFQFMVAFYHELMVSRATAYDACRADLIESAEMQALPPIVVRDARKKRAYLSGVLARAEVNATYRPARKLWYRENMGDYLPNLALQVRVTQEGGQSEWKTLRDVLNVAWMYEFLPPRAGLREARYWENYQEHLAYRRARDAWRAEQAALSSRSGAAGAVHSDG